jgi:hypothetical protein
LVLQRHRSSDYHPIPRLRQNFLSRILHKSSHELYLLPVPA